jgi:hypothetical protein
MGRVVTLRKGEIDNMYFNVPLAYFFNIVFFPVASQGKLFIYLSNL